MQTLNASNQLAKPESRPDEFNRRETVSWMRRNANPLFWAGYLAFFMAVISAIFVENL